MHKSMYVVTQSSIFVLVKIIKTTEKTNNGKMFKFITVDSFDGFLHSCLCKTRFFKDYLMT